MYITLPFHLAQERLRWNLKKLLNGTEKLTAQRHVKGGIKINSVLRRSKIEKHMMLISLPKRETIENVLKTEEVA
jgi:hypothetical protein